MMVEVAVDGAAWSASTAAKWAGTQWKRALTRWLRPYLEAMPRARQRHWAPAYVAGLLGPSAGIAFSRWRPRGRRGLRPAPPFH